ncbi:MAG: tRNA 2-selenouridine(34) synthase MnmH [Chitinophagales bacterium]|nr:tRNA 2-selenouridine(34) synthase MnmH [Chitinophagales bacterium]
MIEAEDVLLLDVRTPSEYNYGHIPGAINLPLFTDEERAAVGTTYKQKGREAAIHAGLDFVGPRLSSIAAQAQELINQNSGKHKLLLYCWRGGMRSASVAWLLNLYGLNPQVIPGGYKAFRRWVINTFEEKYAFAVLGGFTGSGKTLLLNALKNRGFPVVDLEALANHHGSAFGSLGQPQQPTQEHFENMLALALRRADIISKRTAFPIWIEDESRFIGRVFIPPALWKQKIDAPLYILPDLREIRIKNLVHNYGKSDLSELSACILKIRKRLGPERAGLALFELGKGNISRAAEIILEYYDKTYQHSLGRRTGPTPVFLHEMCFDTTAALEYLSSIKLNTATINENIPN